MLLLVALTAMCSAQSAMATCDPNLYPVVNVSLGPWLDFGVVQATVTNTYPRTDGFLESAYLWLDVVDDAHLQWSATVGSGVPHLINVNTSCLPAGPHTVIVRGWNCGKPAETSAGFSVTSNETSVSASLVNGFDEAGNGTLNIAYNFMNTIDYTKREIFVELDGALILNSKRQPTDVSGSYAYPISISCLPPGAHTFVVRARPCGDASRDKTASIPVAVDTTPRLTASLTQPDSNGNVTIQGSVYFPNARGGGFWTGDVYTYVNDEPSYRWHDNIVSQSWGLPPHVFNVTCSGPYQVRLVAVECSGGTATKTMSGGQPGMTQPVLTLKRTGRDASKRSQIHATVKYTFPLPSSGWDVKLDVVEWLEANGTVQDTYSLGGPSPALQSGIWQRDFTTPSEVRQIVVAATMTSCLGSGTDTVALDLPPCCDPPGETNDPVAFADGNVRYSDADPLPNLIDSVGLARTYDSQEGMSRLFGKGWTSFLDQRLVTVSSPVSLVYFTTPDNGVVIFALNGSTYVQRWPKAITAAGTLRYDAAASVFEYRSPGSGRISRFRGDGRFIGYRQITSGRSLDIALDANGLPLIATDSWTGLVWQFHADTVARRVTSIDIAGRPDLVWTYNYDSSGLLLSVLAPGGTPWRTYEYGTWGMTAAYDPLGNLI